MHIRSRSLVALAVAIVTAILGYSVLQAAITLASPYAENFDSMGVPATATTASNLPANFRADNPAAVRAVGSFSTAGTTTARAGGANLSSSASNGIYSFGAGTAALGSADRAVGFLSSGSATQSGNLYTQLTNDTGSALTGLKLSYNVEKYRMGFNAAGFCVQMYYSTTGQAGNWTSAGNTFLTTFPADSGTVNSGYATVPGAVQSVSNATLAVPIPNGTSLYLAWNYSVCSGSTTTNAQALAIDDISIVPGPAATTPVVTSTSPTNGAGNVPVTSPIVVNFDQSVSATATAFQLSCGGIPQAFAATASPSNTFTLTPASSLPLAATCTVSVVAEQVSPAMTANYTFSFVTPLPSANAPVVISQVYGGGGNGGGTSTPPATYLNDFVELFNRSADTVDLTGWSIQYAAATGFGWGSTLQPLGGTIGPGQYLLISLASGGTTGAFLPQANVYGQINMSATNGKVALVNSTNALSGTCPVTDPHVVDFVGYGSTANCFEGAGPTPIPDNATAVLRIHDGATDTNNNRADFVAGVPNPRRTAPIVPLPPSVVNVDPAVNSTIAPFDATMTVSFSKAVDVIGAWFDIDCGGVKHNDVTTAVSSQGRIHYVTPNLTFIPGESCTAKILKNQIADADAKSLAADYVWSFKIATGATPPDTPDVHLAMGNPSGADVNTPDNYLMVKPEYALSYNATLGRPNWVSWHLTDDWTGGLARNDSFRPDPAIPPDWYRVQSFDFSQSGFDRGHMTPNADRNNATLTPDNQATFLMTNMVAQAPDNNQGPWNDLESYLRTLLPVNELYIVSGPLGVGGTGSYGYAETVADGHVAVPAYTWKVALVLPKLDGDDLSRVSCSTRTIAVLMPNVQGISNDWMSYLTKVDDIEARTGYDFFSKLPKPYQQCIEAGINGDNPALVKGTQTITFDQPADAIYGDPPFTVSATGGESGNPVTFEASGACTSDGATITITDAGACAITASQAGSDIYDPATPVARTVTVRKAASSVSGIAAPPVELGAPSVAVSGLVRSGEMIPTGTVTARIGGASASGTVGSDGRFTVLVPAAALTVTGSPYTIAVSYGGDANFLGAAGTGSLTVVDTTAPVIAGVKASPDKLGPPNHKMIDVTVAYAATDFGGATCKLSARSNEAPNGTGDGNTGVDWLVIDAHRLQLRSERAGTGTGRIYTITIGCVDPSSNSSSATTTVTVSK